MYHHTKFRALFWRHFCAYSQRFHTETLEGREITEANGHWHEVLQKYAGAYACTHGHDVTAVGFTKKFEENVG